MSDQATSTEQEILQIIELIHQSHVIPDEKKMSYIDALEKGELTEAMVQELSKMFEQDAQQLDQEIREGQEAIKEFQEDIAAEQEKIDEPQARVLAALEEFHERNEGEFKKTLEGMEKDLEKMEEAGKKEEEKSAEEAIRAKLQKK